MVWLAKDALVSQFVNLLRDEIFYQIRYFGVGLNVGNFMTTHHDIPRYGFNFVSFDTLNALGFDYTYLVDVIGYFSGIRSKKTLEKNDKFTKYNVIGTFYMLAQMGSSYADMVLIR
ncbi:hypothetical protein Ahy_B06g081534 [Arachis hypogaea]|uniref:Uncharacterized protein n=1 Tax=Arachis hypogaea TaxID=3818 RepID=A0A444YL83_ARAHY|nr:hypothetical protein Ahy_B06g081534 [Arachis hypogaea]